jgi:hypothetical protein
MAGESINVRIRAGAFWKPGSDLIAFRHRRHNAVDKLAGAIGSPYAKALPKASCSWPIGYPRK